jgi:putative endonuclease
VSREIIDTVRRLNSIPRSGFIRLIEHMFIKSLNCITIDKMKTHLYYVYILTNANNTVLYTGVTNDLERRLFEHKKKINDGFTNKYNIDKLIYFEEFQFIEQAIAREKQIKKYSRIKKSALIEKFNKDWKELYQDGKIVWQK